MEKDTVFMRSPSGEVREVEPTQEVLTPLMAAGWHQTAAPAREESAEEGK